MIPREKQKDRKDEREKESEIAVEGDGMMEPEGGEGENEPGLGWREAGRCCRRARWSGRKKDEGDEEGEAEGR